MSAAILILLICPFNRANMVDTAVPAAHLLSPELAALGNDVEPKMEELRVLAPSVSAEIPVFCE